MQSLRQQTEVSQHARPLICMLALPVHADLRARLPREVYSLGVIWCS